MSKLTVTQIIEKLKEFPFKLENYATGDFYDEYEEIDYAEEFEEKPEVKKLIDENNEKSRTLRDLLFSHEGHTNIHLRDEEYNNIYKQFVSLSNTNNIVRDAYMLSWGLGPIIEVEQKGGRDEGSRWYTIKHFVDHDVYIKTNGYYSSYDGIEFYDEDDWGYEVFPREVVVTQYFSEKK